MSKYSSESGKLTTYYLEWTHMVSIVGNKTIIVILPSVKGLNW